MIRPDLDYKALESASEPQFWWCSMKLEDFAFGRIQVDGTVYDHDLVIDHGKIKKRKKKPSKKYRESFGHTPLSVEEKIPWNCEQLVIGTGMGTLPVMNEVKQEARRRPKHDGWYALRELNTNPTPVRVILFTADIEKSQIVEALQLGARGVVLKSDGTEVLLEAIQTIKAGEYWVGREPVSNMEQYLRTLTQSIHDEARRLKKLDLNPRELEIVSAVVAGYSNKEIAEYFKICSDTVKHHLSNIFDKLGVSSRLELALFAVNHSLPLKPIV
jgi:DNA-binding NarL/FixJ family response regulator